MTSWRLATFNIESLDSKPADPEGFALRKDALQPVLARIDADILCLQEVNAQHVAGEKTRRFLALDELISDMAYAGYDRATSVQPDTGRPADVHNLVILSRWPIRQSGQIFHDHVPPVAAPIVAGVGDAGRLHFDRPILTATIERPDGRLLHVLNLHLRAPRAIPLRGPGPGQGLSSRAWATGFFLAAIKRQAQALEARLAVEAIFDAESDPLIAVCGDLNADRYETPDKLLRAAPEDSDGRLDRVRTLEALDRLTTAETRYSVLHDGRPLLLDHMLASPALARECREFNILNEGLADEYSSPEMTAGSFHAPLLARFAIG